MAFLIGEIVANVRADSGQFRREMGNVQRTGATASRNTQRALGGIGAQLTSIAFLAKTAFSSALVMGARQAVREFAMLEGAMSKFNVVFGDQARNTEAWIDTLRQRVPLARRELIAAAASMQDLLVPMGVAREDATEMTKEWLELAAALAAFNDVPVSQALEAIRSGIAGQSMPLRQFGIDVREAALQQTALEEGLIKSGEAMTKTARQQALLLQAYRQSKDAIDGYEDQLGSTLMKEQELGATFKDTAAIIGEILQPAYNAMTDLAVDWLNKLSSEIKILQFITRAATGNIETLTDQWNKFLQTPIEDLGYEEITNQLKAVQNEMDAMIERRGSQGMDEDAVKASEAYQVLQSRIMVLDAMLRNLPEDAIPKPDTEEIENLPPTIRDLKKEISDLEELIEDSFDSKQIANYREQVEQLERRIAGMMGELKPEIGADEPIFDIDEALKSVDETMDLLLPKMDFSEFFDTGSIGAMRQEIEELEHALIRTTDPEKVRELQSEINRLTGEMQKMRRETEDATGAARFFSRTLADGLDQVLFRARSVEDAIKGIIRQLASRALTTGIMALLGGGLPEGVSFGAAMFGGNRQSGGGVNPGRGYIVGERGPELFLPQSSGTIVPNQDMGSKTINLNVHVKGGTQLRGKDLRYVIDEQVRQSVRLQ